jgi:hypothetical protein
VRMIHEAMRRGECYVLNLTRRLVGWPVARASTAFASLAARAHADMAAFWATPRMTVVSASPERFVRVAGDGIQVCPIKGTRPRADGDRDADMAAELLASAAVGRRWGDHRGFGSRRGMTRDAVEGVAVSRRRRAVRRAPRNVSSRCGESTASPSPSRASCGRGLRAVGTCAGAGGDGGGGRDAGGRLQPALRNRRSIGGGGGAGVE